MHNRQDRVVVITGAAGGLGSALSRSFAREGHRLFLTDKNEGRLRDLVVELGGEGATVAGAAADLADAPRAGEILDQACQAYGRIDVLVNNAGISRAKSFWELTGADWDGVFAVNVKALFFALRAAAKHMRGGGGSIINIASVAGRLPRPALMHYAASKAAVISITRSAALALARDKIRVNAIAPGMMDTEMFHILCSDLEQSSPGSEAGKPNVNIIPIGRVAQPEEIAASAVFLAGDGAAYITGQTFNVCGGICMS